MPPKKSKRTNESESSKQEPPATDQSNEPPTDETKANGSSTVPSKRKASTKENPSKNPRRSARTASTNPPDTVKLLNYLLSDASLDASRPKDEKEDLKTRDANWRTYSSSTFSPFEELLSAIILSRPISHALGLRSIRTLLNEPYQFTTPKAIRDAGFEGVRKALDEARTQHRQKTAEEIGILADAAVETFGDGDEDVKMEKLRKECGFDFKKERDMLKQNVKGLGNTGLDIFARRVQGLWAEAYPFADQKSISALESFGLPRDLQDLKNLLDEKWNDLKVKDLDGDESEQKRRAFVQVVERVVGISLEGNSDSAKEEKSNSLPTNAKSPEGGPKTAFCNSFTNTQDKGTKIS